MLDCRELDEALGLTATVVLKFSNKQMGNNIQYSVIALVRQSICSRLASYENINKEGVSIQTDFAKSPAGFIGDGTGMPLK